MGNCPEILEGRDTGGQWCLSLWSPEESLDTVQTYLNPSTSEEFHQVACVVFNEPFLSLCFSITSSLHCLFSFAHCFFIFKPWESLRATEFVGKPILHTQWIFISILFEWEVLGDTWDRNHIYLFLIFNYKPVPCSASALFYWVRRVNIVALGQKVDLLYCTCPWTLLGPLSGLDFEIWGYRGKQPRLGIKLSGLGQLKAEVSGSGFSQFKSSPFPLIHGGN